MYKSQIDRDINGRISISKGTVNQSLEELVFCIMRNENTFQNWCMEMKQVHITKKKLSSQTFFNMLDTIIFVLG